MPRTNFSLKLEMGGASMNASSDTYLPIADALAESPSPPAELVHLPALPHIFRLQDFEKRGED